MFQIQLCNPHFNLVKDLNDNKVSEAIETVFPLETEYAFINWNNIFIPLSYKYDISTIIDDLFYLNDVLIENIDHIKLTFPSNTFMTDWEIEVNDLGVLTINSKWYTVIGSLEKLLNENSVLKVTKIDFINELKKLFFFIKNALSKSGYSYESLKDFYKLG